MSGQQASPSASAGVNLAWEAEVVCTCGDTASGTGTEADGDNTATVGDDDGTSTVVPDLRQGPSNVVDWETASTAGSAPTAQLKRSSRWSMPVNGILRGITPWTWMSLAKVKKAIEAQAMEDQRNSLAKLSMLSDSTDLTECPHCGSEKPLRLASLFIKLPVWAMYDDNGTTTYHEGEAVPIRAQNLEAEFEMGTARPLDLYSYWLASKAASYNLKTLHDINRLEGSTTNREGLSPPPFGFCLLACRADFRAASNSLDAGKLTKKGSYEVLPVTQTISLLEEDGKPAVPYHVFQTNLITRRKAAFESWWRE